MRHLIFISFSLLFIRFRTPYIKCDLIILKSETEKGADLKKKKHTPLSHFKVIYSFKGSCILTSCYGKKKLFYLAR